MDYKFLDSSIDVENIVLEDNDKINTFLKKNSEAEIKKAIDFIDSDETLLHIHGFLGTGKRQFINYVADFFSKNTIKLEYYCKASTVCDDILLSFIDIIEKNSISKVVNLNAKVTTLAVKFQQYLSSIKRPFVIILHTYDDILEENQQLVTHFLEQVAPMGNVKIILSTRAMTQELAGEVNIDRKIFLKGFSKDIFKEFLLANGVEFSDTTFEDFYKYTRGYYYYTALTVKIIQGMKISLNEFLQKYALSGMSFDSYLGMTYINLIPATIRNFFWFLRTVRHGLTLNALAVFELLDEFSIEYLKTNLMIFQFGETIYVQDYFQQNIDISIPVKKEIKLHKYIIGIYEKLLKEPLQTREIMISRQALRAEIEYHSNCITELEEGKRQSVEEAEQAEDLPVKTVEKVQETQESTDLILDRAVKLAEEKKNTEAIEEYHKILDSDGIDLHTALNARMALARLYKEIKEYSKSQHYYELAEVYYRQHKEVINLNYLYYELTDLYFQMYKNEKAIDTIKKVIYSVDAPQSLMVAACTLLGNIYASMNNPEEAYSYYDKALASLDENTPEETLAELYFKYALANDDKGDDKIAFEYYSKCLMITANNPYRALAYSNLASCYLDNGNFSDAEACFKKAYEIEKLNNNYDGIYYNALHLAKIYMKEHSPQALEYLLEAKQSAEFINEDFYILEASVALGDYYYNNVAMGKKALIEYFKARKIAQMLSESVDVSKIERRINDMKLRMDKDSFEEIEKKYGI